MLCLNNDIFLIKQAVYLKTYQTIIISDLHLGYEQSLIRSGIGIPATQLSNFKSKLSLIFATVPVKKVILNGDIIHDFGKIGHFEKRIIDEFFDFLSSYEVICIKGNHDAIFAKYFEKQNTTTVLLQNYTLGDNYITHGDKLYPVPSSVNTIIIGHEHPGIVLQSNNRFEKFKCFLYGTSTKVSKAKKNLLILPSFNDTTIGIDILNEKLNSPYVPKKMNNFQVIICGDDLYSFGKVKDVSRLIK